MGQEKNSIVIMMLIMRRTWQQEYLGDNHSDLVGGSSVQKSDDDGHDKIKLEGHDCDNEDDAY